MPRAVPRTALSLLLSLLLFPLLTACERPKGPVVVATVDGEPILAGDLQEVLKEQAEDYDPDLLANPEGREVVKKSALNGLIQEKVLLQTAHAAGIALTPEEERALSEEEPAGYRKGQFERFLRDQQRTPEEWRRRQKRKRLIEKLIEREVYDPLSPTQKEISDYYQKYRALYRLPNRVRCRHIVTGKRDKAEKIRSLLDKGENFANVAKKYSESPDREEGGDLGFIARGDYPEVFERTCFSLAVGQTSDVIASEYGFHIFRVTDKQPSRQRSLQEVAKDIGMKLQEERAAPVLRAWLDELYRNKKISVDEEALGKVNLGAK